MKDILLLLKKAKWLVGGNFVFAFSQWVILIFFARMTNQENLGQYALALAIVTPIFAVGNLQLRPLYILDVNSEQKYTYTHFYYLRLICSFIALVCCLVLGLFFNVSILVFLLVGLLKFFESYSDIIYAYYNAHDQTQLISKSLFLKGTLSVLAVAVGLYLFDFYTALILFFDWLEWHLRHSNIRAMGLSLHTILPQRFWFLLRNRGCFEILSILKFRRHPQFALHWKRL